MTIQDFCVRIQSLQKNDGTIEAMRKIADLDLQELVAHGIPADFWDLWNMDQAPTIVTESS